MKRDIWICLVHTDNAEATVSSDAYYSLTEAADKLMLRIKQAGTWLDEFNYISRDGKHRYELRCVNLEC